MKTAIVIGSTGLVCSKLISLLTKESRFDKIVAVTRRPVEYQAEKVLNEVVDFNALDDFIDVFKGDVLFSCLGTTAKQAGSYDNQRLVDFDYQFQIAKLAAKNGVNHYILISSSGANSVSKSPYLKMKGELEEAVSLLPFDRLSILQPSLLLGERESFRLGETLGSWILPTLCKLPFFMKYRPISADDVAKKLLALSLTKTDQSNSKEVFKLDEIFD